MAAREYFEKGQEALVNTLGGDHTAFQRSLALIEGGAVASDRGVEQDGVGKAAALDATLALSHLQCPCSADN